MRGAISASTGRRRNKRIIYDEEADEDGWSPYTAGNNTKSSGRKKRRTGRAGGHGRSSNMSIDEVLNDPCDPDHKAERREFYRKLERFLGKPPSVNQITGKPLDLYLFYRETLKRGGYQVVCDR
eukprot:UN13139